MFRFLDEIKKNIKEQKQDIFDNFNIINLSGKVIYVEGHFGLLVLSKEVVSFKVKGGYVSVEGNNLILKELTLNTLTICGEIKKVEEF